jgi:hypothetical protein
MSRWDAPAVCRSGWDFTRRMRLAAAAIGVVLAGIGSPAAAQDLSSEALADSLAELSRRIDVLAAELERERVGEAMPTADESHFGFGPAASKVYRSEHGVSIGGYGEMLYQHADAETDSDVLSGRNDQLDWLRAVLYFGYRWNDRWLLNSEIEFEHGSTGEGGEVSVEFAYVDYQWRPELGFRAGLLLVPMGLVNELHEPTVFHGARRPLVETAIIPTTWRENGLGVFGEMENLSYRTYVINGMDARGFTAGGIRGGRQDGAQARADDFAWVGRVDTDFAPGLLAGASVYAGRSGQEVADTTGTVLDVGTVIAEVHADWKWKGLEARALAAFSQLDEVAELNEALGLTGAGGVGEEQNGWYVEAAYDLLSRRQQGEQALFPFVRYESFNTQAEVPSGFTANPATEINVLTAGVDYRPIDPLVFKLEYQDFSNEAESGVDQVNASLGYIF